MTEEELEEELKRLDVKEDLGEDSDITPTNSPAPPNPFAKIHLPHSSNTSGFFDGDFTRFSNYDDSAMLSGSSLSWGEDEFEGEATRTVNALFEQLDQLIYKDAVNKTVKFPIVKIQKSNSKVPEKLKGKTLKELKASDSSSDFFASSESEDETLESGRVQSSKSLPPPSSFLIAECKDWIDNFPHLRVIGVGINLARYERIESRLLPPEEFKSVEETEVNEEIYAADGDYENKLQFRTLKPEVNKEKKKEKSKVPSRICSGSSDPELLKEHVLIKAFDDMWLSMCQIIEPLFTKYAEWLEDQAAHGSSSKTTSALYEREFPNIESKEKKKEALEQASSLPSVIRSPLSRPSSAIYRLPDKVPIKNATNKGSTQFVQYYKNPVEANEKAVGRSLSASRTRERPSHSSTSMPTLPYLVYPSRPVSSLSGNHHLLTPMPTVDYRPQSTASYIRLRPKEKLKFDQTATIEEDKTIIDDLESSSPPWSRHTPFLPRINVEAKTHTKSMASPTSYGKSLSAVARTSKTWQESTKKNLTLDTEPFVSWIVSKVEKQQGEKQVKSPTVKKTLENASPLPFSDTKYFRRLSHH